MGASQQVGSGVFLCDGLRRSSDFVCPQYYSGRGGAGSAAGPLRKFHAGTLLCNQCAAALEPINLPSDQIHAALLNLPFRLPKVEIALHESHPNKERGQHS